MAQPAIPHPPSAASTPSTLRGRRRPPSPAEHARRVAWGHKWGPLVGASIRAALAEHSAQQIESAR